KAGVSFWANDRSAQAGRRRNNEPASRGFLGSARVSRVGFGVSPKQAFLYASRSEEMIVTGRVAIARRNRQHARRVRYPDYDSRSDSRWLDTLSCGTDSCLPLVRSFTPTCGHSSPKTMAKRAPVCSASRNWRAIFALASE